jgi:hypothetical protein
MKSLVIGVGVSEGPYFEERCEDGITTRFNYFVTTSTWAGEFVHPKAFRQRFDAQQFAAKVMVAGYVDLDHWVEAELPESLEERLGECGTEWQREQEERLGYY